MDGSGKSRVIRNYLYSLAYQMMGLVVPLLLIPYLTRVLGQTPLGIFDYIQAIVGYFSLFGSIGIALYGQREIASHKHDPEQRSRIFWELVILRAVFLFVSFLIYFFLIARNSGYTLYYALFAVELFSAAADVSWFYQGLEIFRLQTMRNLLAKVLCVLLVFFFVKKETDLTVYILCYALSNLVGNLSVWFRLKRHLVPVRISLSGLWHHLMPTLLLFLPQIATSVYTQLDKTMIGLLSDYDQVAFYSYAEKIVKVSLTVVTSLNLVMLSRAVDYHVSGDREKLRGAILSSFRFSCGMGLPIAFGLGALSRRFVPWFFGDGWEGSMPVMILLCPIVLFIGLSGVFGVQYLVPTRRNGLFTLSVCTGTVTNLILNFLLIPRMGAVGAAVSTVVAEGLVLAFQMIALRREFPLSIWKYTWKYFLASVIMCPAVYFVGEVLNRRMGGTLIQVLVGGVIYLTLLFLFKDELFLDLVRHFKEKMASRSREDY